MCEIKVKVCSKCGEEKPLTSEYWYREKRSKNGFCSICKDCRKEYKKKYRENNKEKIKKYYQENKEKIKKYLKDNEEHRKEYKKKYYQENKEKIINQVVKNENKRLKNEPIFKMKKHIRRTLNTSFRHKGWTKKTKTQNIIGCDWDTFKIHIENQFQEGMNWDNHGQYGWHYDHIIPLSLATTEEEIIKLNHYTNFQPLWAKENLKKYNKISEEYGNLFD